MVRNSTNIERFGYIIGIFCSTSLFTLFTYNLLLKMYNIHFFNVLLIIMTILFAGAYINKFEND